MSSSEIAHLNDSTTSMELLQPMDVSSDEERSKNKIFVLTCPFCNDEFVFPIVFISHLTKSTVCISVFWPDFMTCFGLLPKRGAPALGNKRESPRTIARSWVYLPLHV